MQESVEKVVEVKFKDMPVSYMKAPWQSQKYKQGTQSCQPILKHYDFDAQIVNIPKVSPYPILPNSQKIQEEYFKQQP